jgi:hypothetical protein
MTEQRPIAGRPRITREDQAALAELLHRRPDLHGVGITHLTHAATEGA